MTPASGPSGAIPMVPVRGSVLMVEVSFVRPVLASAGAQRGWPVVARAMRRTRVFYPWSRSTRRSTSATVTVIAE